MTTFRIKRIYDEPAKSDGYRVLIDRLWPRGVSKARAALDAWDKDSAPSSDLRVWFGHKPELFTEFSQRYVAELDQNPAVQKLKEDAKDHEIVTLLYAAHDPQINHARVLQVYLANEKTAK